MIHQLSPTSFPRVPILLALLAAPLSAPAQTTTLARERGAIYLEDILPNALSMTVKKKAPIYYDVGGKRRLGTFLGNQQVRIEAVSERAFRVRGRATHAVVSGWVGTAFFEIPDPDFVANIKKLQQRHESVQKLIAKNQIALGMTPGEVVASLGEPDSRSSVVNAAGVEETLDFIIYERVPRIVIRHDVYGRPFRTTVWVKTETGRRSVDFKDGLVSAIRKNQKTVPRRRLPTVPPPVVIIR